MDDRGTVLIIDDDDDWRALLFEYLVDRYDTMAIGDYPSAVDLITTRSFDVIVLDLRLDDKDDNNFQGMGLLAVLRDKERDESWNTSVVIVSAYGTPQQIREGFKFHSLFDYIPKQSLDKREYRETVHRAVRQRQRIGS